ncbi:hypothetical protein GCM10010985_14150 [Caballeronia grimmiae]|uniref:Uncharacterized protein n=1 Tax=Caballeronia grimmiae TaxID=1071679 RepID=A0ABQ1R9Q3_9BURK|nr:hypothetical protein GCM10010985_14150 [Caballeronia grimmiae]
MAIGGYRQGSIGRFGAVGAGLSASPESFLPLPLRPVQPELTPFAARVPSADSSRAVSRSFWFPSIHFA